MLKVYDKNLSAIGYVVQADQVARNRRLNSDYGISFLIPMDSDDYTQKIALKGHVMDEKGQYYVINSRKRNREGKKLTAQIDCTHIMFKLTDFLMPYSSYMAEGFGVDISTLTDLISAATGGVFTFSIDDTFDVMDIKDFGRGNAMEALAFVIKTYTCEIDPDNFLIHVKKQIGADNGLQYRFKKNIISNNFTDSTQGLTTRMYGQMKDGLTFIGLAATNLTSDEYTLLNAIPGAIVGGIIMVNYLISQYAGTWTNSTNTYFDGEHIDQNIEDQLELLKAVRKALAETEVPSIDVTIDAADLYKIDNTEPKPNMGDTVYLIDPLMDLNSITARVVELTEYPYQMDKHSTVTLANYMLKDYHDIIADLDASKRVVDDLMSGGKVRTSLFEAFAEQAVIDINNSKTEIKYDSRGIVLQSTANPLHQVILTSDGIILTLDGGVTATDAISAIGISAPAIVGILGDFAQVRTDNLIAGTAKISTALIDNLTVGSNVSIGTAQDAAGVTSIIGGTVTTGYINALSVTSKRLTVTSGSVTLLDGFNDVNGGVLKVYDSSGNLNVKLGVESGTGDNVGGTFVLYNDAPSGTTGFSSKQRVEAGILTSGDYGILTLRDTNAKARITIEAANASYGPYIGVRDSSESLVSYLTATAGYINGYPILTTASTVYAKFA